MDLKCELAKVDNVCGSDGVTHANECFLNMTACMTKTKITALHKGRCTEEETMRSSIGKYYGNQCADCKFKSECVYIEASKIYHCICSRFDCSNYPKLLLFVFN